MAGSKRTLLLLLIALASHKVDAWLDGERSSVAVTPAPPPSPSRTSDEVFCNDASKAPVLPRSIARTENTSTIECAAGAAPVPYSCWPMQSGANGENTTAETSGRALCLQPPGCSPELLSASWCSICAGGKKSKRTAMLQPNALVSASVTHLNVSTAACLVGSSRQWEPDRQRHSSSGVEAGLPMQRSPGRPPPSSTGDAPRQAALSRRTAPLHVASRRLAAPPSPPIDPKVPPLDTSSTPHKTRCPHVFQHPVCPAWLRHDVQTWRLVLP
jgi:hypothetical protein